MKVNDSMPEYVLAKVADIMKDKGMTDFNVLALWINI